MPDQKLFNQLFPRGNSLILPAYGGYTDKKWWKTHIQSELLIEFPTTFFRRKPYKIFSHGQLTHSYCLCELSFNIIDTCFLINFQSVEKPVQLLFCNLIRLCVIGLLPSEMTFLQPLIQQPESAAIPVQAFDLIVIPVTENIQAVIHRILMKDVLYNLRITVYSFTQICYTSGEINISCL